MAQVTRALLILVAALVLAPLAQADRHPGPPAHAAAGASWWPDGVVCDAFGDCRYVAPGCELVRVMDTDPLLAGTRRVLVCRAPRGAV